MREIPEDVLYDKRLVDRHIRQGLITRQQVEQRVAAAEDVAKQGDKINVQNLLEPGEGAQRA